MALSLVYGLILGFSVSSEPADQPDILSLFTTPTNPVTFDYCNVEAADWQKKALIEKLEKYSADDARQYVDQRVTTILISAAAKVFAVQPSHQACKDTFKKGDQIFDAVFTRVTKELKKNTPSPVFKNTEIDNIKASILRAWLEDQASRLAYIELLNPETQGSAEYWAFERAKANAVKLDGQHRQLIKKLLGTYNWIDREHFGQDTSVRALTLIQHADAEPTFQKMALNRMKPYVENGSISGTAYAYLWDRVAINIGTKQRYGTQPKPNCNADGTLSIMPVEAPEKLNQLRKEIGLEPLSAQLKRLSEERCK